MLEFFNLILESKGIKILIIVIVLDLIFGVLRAIKERDLNSCIGIDGMIRKVGMLIALIFLSLIDLIVNLNLIGFIPETIRNTLEIGNVGIADLFSLLFIIFEILSVFKNAILCNLPIPKKLQNFLKNILEEFTSETKKEGE